MTLVIVIRHIDLSVGFLAGFLGAVAAIALRFWELPTIVVVPMVMVMGMLAGLLTALPVAELKIPSFVASLAGWLIYRGALQLVTAGTGTIIIEDETFNAIGNGFIPDVPFSLVPGYHTLTLLLGLVAIVAYVLSEVRTRSKKLSYNFEVLPLDMFVLKLVFISTLIGLLAWIMAGYNGLSWTMVIVLVVVAIYHFVTTQTVLGRHIYAVGGNPEAAELSGISVKRITYIVFASMGMLSALSGVLFASRLRSATTTAGTLFELDAIAAAYIGGVSAAGGVGNVIGSIIGALVYVSLTSGMNLMGIDIAYQYIVRGLVLVAAVIFDVTTRRRGRAG
jgi:putative multiple sugar transport system permease protein